MKLPKTVTIPYLVYLIPALFIGIIADTLLETILFAGIYGIIAVYSGEFNFDE